MCTIWELIVRLLNRIEDLGFESAVLRNGVGNYKFDIQLTLLISSCMRCFFVSRVDPSGFNFRLHRSLSKTPKPGLRCNVSGGTGGSIF